MADYVVHRIGPDRVRFGIFEVRGKRPLFERDFDRTKDAFGFLRGQGIGHISVSKVHSNWLVYIT